MHASQEMLTQRSEILEQLICTSETRGRECEAQAFSQLALKGLRVGHNEQSCSSASYPVASLQHLLECILLFLEVVSLLPNFVESC